MGKNQSDKSDKGVAVTSPATETETETGERIPRLPTIKEFLSWSDKTMYLTSESQVQRIASQAETIQEALEIVSVWREGRERFITSDPILQAKAARAYRSGREEKLTRAKAIVNGYVEDGNKFIDGLIPSAGELFACRYNGNESGTVSFSIVSDETDTKGMKYKVTLKATITALDLKEEEKTLKSTKTNEETESKSN